MQKNESKPHKGELTRCILNGFVSKWRFSKFLKSGLLCSWPFSERSVYLRVPAFPTEVKSLAFAKQSPTKENRIKWSKVHMGFWQHWCETPECNRMPSLFDDVGFVVFKRRVGNINVWLKNNLHYQIGLCWNWCLRRLCYSKMLQQRHHDVKPM